jgi:hypothetical protein
MQVSFLFLLNACVQTWQYYSERLSALSFNKVGEDEAYIEYYKAFKHFKFIKALFNGKYDME